MEGIWDRKCGTIPYLLYDESSWTAATDPPPTRMKNVCNVDQSVLTTGFIFLPAVPLGCSAARHAAARSLL